MTRTTIKLLRGMGSALELVPPVEPCRVGRGIDRDRSNSEALLRDWDRVAQDFTTAFHETVKVPGGHVESQQTE